MQLHRAREDFEAAGARFYMDSLVRRAAALSGLSAENMTRGPNWLFMDLGRRLERAQAGESVVGRIPRGPHRLAEAQAHLDREVARQQAKLDHRAAVIA